jgi:hypothetical protein
LIHRGIIYHVRRRLQRRTRHLARKLEKFAIRQAERDDVEVSLRLVPTSLDAHDVGQSTVKQPQAIAAPVATSGSIGPDLIVPDDSHSNRLADQPIHGNRFVRIPYQRGKPVKVNSIQREFLLNLLTHPLWYAQ